VGAALVIDNSKYRRAILEVDAENRTAKVEPGLVLDHLNAQLKRHGLWHPVDVSTSAQATLGGMAGNNSCGSRSIAYGNMVHNVLGATAWLSDGSEAAFGPVQGLAGRAARIADFVRDLAAGRPCAAAGHALRRCGRGAAGSAGRTCAGLRTVRRLHARPARLPAIAHIEPLEQVEDLAA